jgi:hypothetical protein
LRLWEHKRRKTDTRSAEKNPDQVCAFCASSFAPFVFLNCVIRSNQRHCPDAAIHANETRLGAHRSRGADFKASRLKIYHGLFERPFPRPDH